MKADVVLTCPYCGAKETFTMITDHASATTVASRQRTVSDGGHLSFEKCAVCGEDYVSELVPHFSVTAGTFKIVKP